FLPRGTVISNVADGIQDTDAANLGQVMTIVSQATSGGLLRSGGLLKGTMLGATPSGSGADTSGLRGTYLTAAYSSQVSGRIDNSGSTPPSDIARVDFGSGSIAIGSSAYAHSDKSTAVGLQAYTSGSDSVALGSGSVANQNNVVSVGNDGTSSYTAFDANG